MGWFPSSYWRAATQPQDFSAQACRTDTELLLSKFQQLEVQNSRTEEELLRQKQCADALREDLQESRRWNQQLRHELDQAKKARQRAEAETFVAGRWPQAAVGDEGLATLEAHT